jgi:hypothetical protein
VPVTFNVLAASVSLDGGWQYSGDDDRHYATWGANISLPLDKSFSAVAEEFGKNTGHAGQQIGLSWQSQDQFILADAVYGHDIMGSPGNWVTTAIALFF